MTKKHGTICVYIDPHDLNHACPKDNYLMPSIDQLFDFCIGHKTISFMNGFLGYNQIQIHPEDQYKTTFTTPWGTFAYSIMSFGLKNVGSTFQWAMNLCFHDLDDIVIVYLDDLIIRSNKWPNHLEDVCKVFHKCHKYNICLNPLKSVFYILASCLSRFIVYHKGIIVESLKFQAILDIPPYIACC